MLATGKVRHVGELVAMCVGADARRSRGHRGRGRRSISRSCPPSTTCWQAREPGAALVHEHWGDNVFLETIVDVDIASGARRADQGDARDFAPRGSACRRSKAAASSRPGITGSTSSCSIPRPRCRTSRAPALPSASASSRAGSASSRPMSAAASATRASCCRRKSASPGWRCVAAIRCAGSRTAASSSPPTPIAASTTTSSPPMPTRRPAARHRLRGDRRFRRLLGLSVLGVPGGGAGRLHPAGPLLMPAYRCRTFSVATNKPPILPYRGVARTGVCFALELMLDAVARGSRAGAGRGAPAQSGAAASRCRSTTSPSKHFDSGDYPEALRRAHRGDRPRRRARAPAQAASRTAAASASASRSTASRPRTAPRSMPAGAFRWCRATSRRPRASRPTAGWNCASACISHGQGLETTLAQVAHEILGVDAAQRARRARRHRDDAVFHRHLGLALHGHGGRRGRDRLPRAGASASQRIGAAAAAGTSRLRCVLQRRRGVAAPAAASPDAEIARTWYRRPQDLPADVDPGGLEVTAGYKPQRDTGTFSYAAHAAVVAVDPELGEVEILDYVDRRGRRHAGQPDDRRRPDLSAALAQGIGTALYEEMPFDAAGQPLALDARRLSAAGRRPRCRTSAS